MYNSHGTVTARRPFSQKGSAGEHSLAEPDLFSICFQYGIFIILLSGNPVTVFTCCIFLSVFKIPAIESMIISQGISGIPQQNSSI
jgi:hypothetical protein